MTSFFLFFVNNYLFPFSLSSECRLFPHTAVSHNHILFLWTKLNLNKPERPRDSERQDQPRQRALVSERTSNLQKMALKFNPLVSQPYKLASSARPPVSTFRSPKFLCLASSSSSPALSSRYLSPSLHPPVSFLNNILLPIVHKRFGPLLSLCFWVQLVCSVMDLCYVDFSSMYCLPHICLMLLSMDVLSIWMGPSSVILCLGPIDSSIQCSPFLI